MLSVHAIVDGTGADAERLAAAGVDGVDCVRHDDLVALVSPADGDEPLPTRRNLRSHAAVVEHAHAVAATLPLRFGVVAEDADAVVEKLLRASASQLRARLEAVRGHDEHRLRATWDVAAASAAAVAGDRGLQRLQRRRGLDARIALGRGVVEALSVRADGLRTRVVAALREHASDAVVDDVRDPTTAFVVSFLVPRAAEADFQSALDRVASDVNDVELTLVGPLPAYSFTGAI